MDFELEKLVTYLIAAASGSVFAYFNKMRKDLTAAHRKIRAIEKHINMDKPHDG